MNKKPIINENIDAEMEAFKLRLEKELQKVIEMPTSKIRKIVKATKIGLRHLQNL